MVGTGCEHDGVIYRNGQSFSPSCKYQCVCVNGAIGCVALCTESQPPRVWCQSPRRVKVRGQCCEQWICDEPKRGRKTAPRHAVEGRTPGDNKSIHRGRVEQFSAQSKWISSPTLKFPATLNPLPSYETRFVAECQHQGCSIKGSAWDTVRERKSRK